MNKSNKRWLFWQKASWVAAAIGWPMYYVVKMLETIL